MPPHVRFSVFDRALRDEIKEGIIPHFPSNTADFWEYADGTLYHCDLLMVGCSGLPMDTARTVILKRGGSPACGLIIRTEDRAVWREMAELHKKLPFRLVIPVGGPRDEMPKLFPGTNLSNDVLAIREPGEQLARLIYLIAGAEARERNAVLSKVSQPYAGNMG